MDRTTHWAGLAERLGMTLDETNEMINTILNDPDRLDEYPDLAARIYEFRASNPGHAAHHQEEE